MTLGGSAAHTVRQAAHYLRCIIRTERPRLVLLDLMLPEADCIELMGQVPELADVPVIFISGYRRDETLAKALEAGAADYLVKPFSPTELVAGPGSAPVPRGARALLGGRVRHRLPAAPVTVGGEVSSSPPRSTSCCACSRSTPEGS